MVLGITENMVGGMVCIWMLTYIFIFHSLPEVAYSFISTEFLKRPGFFSHWQCAIALEMCLFALEITVSYINPFLKFLFWNSLRFIENLQG